MNRPPSVQLRNHKPVPEAVAPPVANTYSQTFKPMRDHKGIEIAGSPIMKNIEEQVCDRHSDEAHRLMMEAHEDQFQSQFGKKLAQQYRE